MMGLRTRSTICVMRRQIHTGSLHTFPDTRFLLYINNQHQQKVVTMFICIPVPRVLYVTTYLSLDRGVYL